ncbi:MAG: ABC-2 family transporter protein [Actinomycetota bacterium]
MRLWWEVARRGFRRYATYRWATVAGVFTNSVFGFIRAYVYIALFAGLGDRIGAWDLPDTLTYTFVSQGLLMPLYLWGWQEIAETVYSGQIASDLYRPFDYQLYWLSQDLGRATYHVLMRGIPPFIVGALFFELRVPTDPVTWLAFTVSFFLAVTVSFAMRFMVNLSAFWIINERGVHSIAAAAWTLLSGFTIPIAFFPDTARTIVRTLPFVAMFELPVDVFLEHVRGLEVLGTLAIQATWALVLLGAGRVMLGAGARKLVVQGG